MSNRKALHFIIILCKLFVFTGFVNVTIAQKNLIIRFHHTIGNEELVLGNSFQNIHGEELTPQKFKYYLSNFAITQIDGKTVKLPVKYFLIDEANADSKTIQLSVPTNNINSIQFTLGVDSIRNVSGIQTGALDPMQGMFWTWNSGYIMAKLEGTSNASLQAGRTFTYHIGGFQSPNNTLQQIKLSLPQKENGIREIAILADINQWFKSASDIHIAQTPNCQSPGTLAVKISANYAHQFTVKSVN
jgi:hypothetical protein